MIAAGGAQIIGSFVPMAAAPVSDNVLADAVIHEEVSALDMLDASTAPVHEDLTGYESESMTEDLTEEMA